MCLVTRNLFNVLLDIPISIFLDLGKNKQPKITIKRIAIGIYNSRFGMTLQVIDIVITQWKTVTVLSGMEN